MRLIDADALFKAFEKAAWYNNADRDEIAEELLLQMPTIEQTTWISCEDRMPEKAKDYLCRCIVNEVKCYPFYMVLRYMLIDENPHFQHEMTGGLKVTHWMPLPQPPKGDE